MKFSVLATFTGVRKDCCPSEVGLDDAIRACEKAGIGESGPSEIGNSEYSYLAEELPDSDWFKRLQDYQGSGIIDKSTLNNLIDDLGAYMEPTETMGTLGGPLGTGMAADVSFTCESSILIECIRVTPIPYGRDGEPLLGDERTWPRLKKAMLAVYGM